MSLFRTPKMLNVRFPHFLLSALLSPGGAVAAPKEQAVLRRTTDGPPPHDCRPSGGGLLSC